MSVPLDLYACCWRSLAVNCPTMPSLKQLARTLRYDVVLSRPSDASCRTRWLA